MVVCGCDAAAIAECWLLPGSGFCPGNTPSCLRTNHIMPAAALTDHTTTTMHTPPAGRILNSVWSGYSVGVAGVVAFMPARQCSRPTARRIGQLQKFRILELDRTRPALVLADPNIHIPSGAGMATGSSRAGAKDAKGAGGFGRARPPRSQEDAARRQELSRVADELRSVLALRSTEESSTGSGSGGAAASPRSS